MYLHSLFKHKGPLRRSISITENILIKKERGPKSHPFRTTRRLGSHPIKTHADLDIRFYYCPDFIQASRPRPKWMNN